MCVNELWKPYLLVQSHRCMALSPRLTLVVSSSALQTLQLSATLAFSQLGLGPVWHAGGIWSVLISTGIWGTRREAKSTDLGLRSV